MRCSHCNSAFRLSSWIMKCGECKDQYCTKCMKRTNGIHYCEKCVVLVARPPDLNQLMKLKSRDLQEYLKRHNICTSGVIEKRDLVELLCNKAIPVKNTKSSAVFNKLYTNFETVFLQEKNDRGSQTSPTTAQPPPRPPNIPCTSTGNSNTTSHTVFQTLFSQETNDRSSQTTPTAAQPPPRPSSAPSSSTNNLNSTAHNLFQSSGEDTGASHTLPKESRTSRPSGVSSNLSDYSTSTSGIDAMKDREQPSPVVRRYPQLSDYNSAEELSGLSTKELKLLLTFNRVEYRGCVEKRELLEKAERLWYDNDRLQHREVPENDENLCKLCLDSPLDCVLLECGHIATCVSCGKKLAECPICRQYVTRVVRTFKA